MEVGQKLTSKPCPKGANSTMLFFRRITEKDRILNQKKDNISFFCWKKSTSVDPMVFSIGVFQKKEILERKYENMKMLRVTVKTLVKQLTLDLTFLSGLIEMISIWFIWIFFMGLLRDFLVGIISVCLNLCLSCALFCDLYVVINLASGFFRI